MFGFDHFDDDFYTDSSYDYCLPSRSRGRVYNTKKYDVKEICETKDKQETLDSVPIRKLIIANIAKSTTHKELKEEFSCFGKINDCILKKQRGDKKSYAFITFDKPEEAQKAINAGYRTKIRIDGQYLRVIPAVPWHQPDSSDNQHRFDKSLEPDEDQITNCTNYAIVDETPINKLNNDCLMHVFMQLPFIDKIRIERVCKHWQVVSKESWSLQRQLDLSPSRWGRKVNAPILHKILIQCGSYLTHIDLSENCGNLGNATLIAIAKLCPNIQSINIGYPVKASGIKALAVNYKNILKFTLFSKNSFYIDYSKELSLLFSNNQKLKYLTLDCSTCKMESLVHLSAKFLEEITLFCFPIDKLSKICHKFNNLHTLNLSRHKYTIPFHVYSYNDMKLSRLIDNIKNLKIISLSDCKYLGDEFFSELSKNCLELCSVDISNCKNLTENGVASITSLPKLEYLNISNNESISDEVLICIPNLKVLDCSYCLNVHDPGIISLIKTSDNLEVINLSGCKNISNEVVYAAIEITKHRKNKILKIYVEDTAVDMNLITELPPFLQIKNIKPAYPYETEWKKKDFWARFYNELYQ